MNTLERSGAAVGVVVFAFGVGAGWNALNNRIDKIDDRMAKIEKALGSTACNAILPRQMEAIEKNRKEAREALEALSKQYGCGPQSAKSSI